MWFDTERGGKNLLIYCIRFHEYLDESQESTTLLQNYPWFLHGEFERRRNHVFCAKSLKDI